MPPKKPSIVEVPPMNYIAVRGKGNPNDENSEYIESIGLLYGIAFYKAMGAQLAECPIKELAEAEPYDRQIKDCSIGLIFKELKIFY